MSKRKEREQYEDETDDIKNTDEQGAPRDDSDDEDPCYAPALRKWKECKVIRDGIRTSLPDLKKDPELTGIISLPVVVKDSLLAHCDKMGYNNDNGEERSLMQVYCRGSFKKGMESGKEIGIVVLHQIVYLLDEIYKGSKPKKFTFNGLPFVRPQYVQPVADMISILLSRYSAVKDLDLLWKFLETIWCLKPMQTVKDLDNVCLEISKRKKEVLEEKCLTEKLGDGDPPPVMQELLAILRKQYPDGPFAAIPLLHHVSQETGKEAPPGMNLKQKLLHFCKTLSLI